MDLRTLRLEAGLTQHQLAPLCGHTRGWVEHVERGRVNPRPEDEAKWVEACTTVTKCGVCGASPSRLGVICSCGWTPAGSFLDWLSRNRLENELRRNAEWRRS